MARMLFLCVVYASFFKCMAMVVSTSNPVTPRTSVSQLLSVTQERTSTTNRSKRKMESLESSLLKYLRKFKYLDSSSCPSCHQDASIISDALSTLQQWAHINNTGILDSDTVELMSKRRCGVPDEPKQFSVSNIKNKRHKRSLFWHIYHGSRWHKNDLTYIINMPHKFPNKRAVEKIISAALHAWESVTQLTFTQKRYGYADIEVNFLTGRHGDGSPFDGNGGILAHAFFPYNNSPGLSGDAHFDADEDWGSEMDLNTTADLYCVAVHEFGHSLGLMHSRWPISIMWPWMKGDCTLSKFDIAVIQKIYGPASERKWKRPRPTTLPPQTTRSLIKFNWPTIPATLPSVPTSSMQTAEISTLPAVTISATKDFQNTVTTSEFENLRTTIDFQNTATTSEFQNTATTSDFQNTATTSDFQNTATTSDFQNTATTSDFQNTATTSDFQNTATTSDFQNTATTSDFQNTATTSDFQNTATTSDFQNIATTTDFQNTATTNELTGGNIDIIITNAVTSPEHMFTTIEQMDEPSEKSKTSPMTTIFADQGSNTKSDFALNQHGFQTKETATYKSAVKIKTAQTSFPLIFDSSTLTSQNPQSTIDNFLPKTLSNFHTENVLSRLPLSELMGLAEHQTADQNLSSERPLSTLDPFSGSTQSFFPNRKASSHDQNSPKYKSRQSKQNILPFLSIPNRLSFQTRFSQPNNLSKSQILDSSATPSVGTLFTKTRLASKKKLPDLPFESSVPYQKSSSFPSTSFSVNTSRFKLNKLPSPNLLYSYRNHLKYFSDQNEINKPQQNMLSSIPNYPPFSPLNPNSYLKTPKEASYLDNSVYDPKSMQNLIGENSLKKIISKPSVFGKKKTKHIYPLSPKTEQLSREVESVTSQSESNESNSSRRKTLQFTDIQHSPKIATRHFAENQDFHIHQFPKQNAFSPSTQLYKTATVSMTTKPVLLLNGFKEMVITPTLQVSIDSEPTVPSKTSSGSSLELRLQLVKDRHNLQEDSFTNIFHTDAKKNKLKSQGTSYQIITKEPNAEGFQLKPNEKKSHKNLRKSLKNSKNKDEFPEKKRTPEQPYILKELTNEKPNLIRVVPTPLHRNLSSKLEPFTFQYSKTDKKLPQPEASAPDITKTMTTSSRVPLIYSEAVPGFGKALRQQNREREVFLPSSLYKSVIKTFLKSSVHPTTDVPFIDSNNQSLSSSTTLFAGGATTRRNYPFRVIGGKKRVKLFKPRYRQKMRMQQFVQSLLYSTMQMVPQQRAPLPDLKFYPQTTPSLHQNIDVGQRTLSVPPMNRTLFRVVTSSFKAKPYKVPQAISHRFLGSQTPPTTQKLTGDTQRNQPQLLNLQSEKTVENELNEAVRLVSSNQQTTPLRLTIQDPLKPQQFNKEKKDNAKYSGLQTSSSEFLKPRLDASEQENIQTTPETAPHGFEAQNKQQKIFLPVYTKNQNKETESSLSSLIHKRSINNSVQNIEPKAQENWSAMYPTTLATTHSSYSLSNSDNNQVASKILFGHDSTVDSFSYESTYHHYSLLNDFTTTTTTTATTLSRKNSKKADLMQTLCSGSIQIDAATVDANGTVFIFNGSRLMRFPLCGKGNKKKKTLTPISRIFPNGPNNVTAAASIIIGKNRRWQRIYLFQGSAVWRYRKCRRRYCLDRGYPTDISQEFNVSSPIEVTAAYTNNYRRTLFLFNGTSFYHAVRCVRWSRKIDCSSTMAEIRPGLLSSLRAIDATFAYQGSFFVIHGGSYFTTTLRSMKSNVFQHGSILENWYGCP